MASNTMNTEKLYVGQFTTDKLPRSYTTEDAEHNDLPRAPPKSAPFPITFDFEINEVMHSTHTSQKEKIYNKETGKASFRANPKERSKWCDDSVIRSYEDQQWNEESLHPKNPLPGHYVWFSMKPTLPKDEKFDKAHYPVSYVDGTNWYGPWSFTFGYSELIEAYKKQIPAGAHVVLKNGGTLMYKNEVSYVVIVTHSHDDIHCDELYPSIKTSHTTGEVLTLGDNYTTPPKFRPKYVPPPFSIKPKDPKQKRWVGYDWNKLRHYDHVIFAVHCDWKDNMFIIDHNGDPYRWFSDHDHTNKESYKQFHPLCHAYGRDKENFPQCYQTESNEWEKKLGDEKAKAQSKKMKMSTTKTDE